MQEIINIIKEIKEIEKLNNEMEENKNYVIDTRNTEKTDKKYSHDVEGELLQEFDETKDVYKKRELAEQIKTARKNRLNQLNEKLDKAIEEKSEQLKNEIEQKKAKIEENKNAMYTMKNNRDMLKEHMNDKAWQRTYDLIGEDMRYKREENVLLNKEIKKIKSKMEELKNRNFEKILEELEEQKTEQQERVEQEIEKTKQEEVKPEAEQPKPEEVEPETEQSKPEEVKPEVEQPKPEEVKPEVEQPKPEKVKPEVEQLKPEEIEPEAEPLKPEKQTEQTNSNQMPPVTDNILDNSEIADDNNSKNKITIYYDSADIELPKYKFSLDLFKENDIITEIMNSLSDTTKDKLISTMDMSRDGAIIKALLVDEKRLNDYLDICSLYNYRYEPIPEIENAIEGYQAPEDFPTIEYNLKESKHDNRKLNNAEKIEMYNRAKATQKMFKYLKMADKVSIKIGLLDRVYCEASNFVQGFKNGIEGLKNRLALGPVKEEKVNNKDLEASQAIEAGKAPEQEKEPSLRERVKVERDKQEEVVVHSEFQKTLHKISANRHERQNKEEEKE